MSGEVAEYGFTAGDYVRIYVIADTGTDIIVEIEEGGNPMKAVLKGERGEHTEFLAVDDGVVRYDPSTITVNSIRITGV